MSIQTTKDALGNAGDFDDGALFARLRFLPCFDGKEEEEVRAALLRHRFHIACGKTDLSLAALDSLYTLGQRFGIRRFLLLTNGAAEKDRLSVTLSVMRRYFMERYDDLRLTIVPYDSTDPRPLRDFVLSEGMGLLVVNRDAFIHRNNRIRRPSPYLLDLSPVSLLRPARCVAVTVTRRISEAEALLRYADLFNPLCCLSFTETRDALPPIPLLDLERAGAKAAGKGRSALETMEDTTVRTTVRGQNDSGKGQRSFWLEPPDELAEQTEPDEPFKQTEPDALTEPFEHAELAEPTDPAET